MLKDAATLEIAGKALFGPHWEGPLATELGVNDRSLRRWQSDPTSIPEGVWRDLAAVCRRKAEDLINLAERLCSPQQNS